MAVLIGSVPAGLTFQELVGGSVPRASATPDHDHSARALPGDQLMRIRVPEGGVEETALPQHQGFLAAYRFTHASGDVAEDVTKAA